MQKRNIDMLLRFLRAFFISFEFLFLICGVVLFIYRERLQALGVIAQDYELVKWVALLPSGLLVWTLKSWKKIREPANVHVKFYQQWEGFESIKIVCVAGVIYAVGAALGGVILLACSGIICRTCITIGLVVVISVSCVCSLTMYMAEMRLPELLNELDATGKH